MKVLIVSGIILILLVIGFMNLFLRAYKKAKDRNFANEYLNKYRILVNKFPYSFDDEVFEWIQKNSVKLQNNMGYYGVLANYSPPYATYGYKQYQVIVNTTMKLQTIYSEMKNRDFCLDSNDLAMMDNMILSYEGVLENEIDNIKNHLKNPFILVREGIQLIVCLPITIIYWSGLVKYATYNRIGESYLIKLVSFIIAVIGGISSILTIMGSTEIINSILRYFGR